LFAGPSSAGVIEAIRSLEQREGGRGVLGVVAPDRLNEVRGIDRVNDDPSMCVPTKRADRSGHNLRLSCCCASSNT
jgi:hypothetical protein